MTAPNLAYKNCAKFSRSALEKYLLFFELVDNFVHIFLPTILTCWPSGLLGSFVDLYGLVSPVTCAEIPLCAKNSVPMMSWVQRKPYDTRHPRNSRPNHATMPGIFSIVCIFLIFPVWQCKVDAKLSPRQLVTVLQISAAPVCTCTCDGQLFVIGHICQIILQIIP